MKTVDVDSRLVECLPAETIKRLEGIALSLPLGTKQVERVAEYVIGCWRDILGEYHVRMQDSPKSAR